MNIEEKNTGSTNTMVLDIEPFNGQFSDEMKKLMAAHLPQVHAESFNHFVEQNKILKAAYSGLEERFKLVAEDKVALLNKNEELQNEVTNFKAREMSIEAKESDVAKRIAEVSEREMVQNHKEEIALLKLTSEKSKVLLMTDTMKCVFKPASLRSEIHKKIPVTVEEYQSYYNAETCNTEIRKSGEHVEDEHSEEQNTTHEE